MIGTVYNRGSRGKPNWYVSYKDADGTRRAVASRQPTKALARKFLEQIEARIAPGMVGIKEPKKEPRCEELMTRWADALRNRNAWDDQSRLRRHLLPVFGSRRLSEITLSTIMEWLDDQQARGELSDASVNGSPDP